MFNQVTPTTVRTILNNARQEYKEMFEMNKHHVLLQKVELGDVFIRSGNVYVFTGINGRNRKFPVMATNAETRKNYKMPMVALEKIGKNNESKS